MPTYTNTLKTHLLWEAPSTAIPGLWASVGEVCREAARLKNHLSSGLALEQHEVALFVEFAGFALGNHLGIDALDARSHDLHARCSACALRTCTLRMPRIIFIQQRSHTAHRRRYRCDRTAKGGHVMLARPSNWVKRRTPSWPIVDKSVLSIFPKIMGCPSLLRIPKPRITTRHAHYSEPRKRDWNNVARHEARTRSVENGRPESRPIYNLYFSNSRPAASRASSSASVSICVGILREHIEL